MNENLKRAGALKIQQLAKKLEACNFGVTCVETKEEALAYLKEVIPQGASIGVGGSATLTECGVLDWLTGNKDYNFLDRYHTDDVKKVFHESLSADVYLMSTNAVTMEGQLYNVDGTGNRTAALIYGPEKVYVLCGVNKIVKDLDEAIKRVEMITAPANNLRLNKENACTKTGSCVHCYASTSTCNQFVITRRSGIQGRIHLILINEALGF